MQTIKVILFLLTICTLLSVASATIVDVDSPAVTRGAVLLIVDGMGSSYIYPEFTPYALDGSALNRANVSNIMLIADGGARVLDIRAPQTSTAPGHSVLVTGYSRADTELVGRGWATIFDVLRVHDYLCLAVMQKGDFKEMRAKQDAILFDASASIRNPSIDMEARPHVPAGLHELMQTWQKRLPNYLDGKEGVERYAAYNGWAIDASNAIIRYMAENHPTQKFLLTVNVGAVDLAGHYLGSERYVKVIEELDRDLYELYQTCIEKDIVLIITADHGMAFPRQGARGGHASDKYADTLEAQRIPLIISGPNVRVGVVESGKQSDIAPTLLSILDVMDTLPYSDGGVILIKEYANLRVVTGSPMDIVLQKDGVVISSVTSDDVTFVGLAFGNYTIFAGPHIERIDIQHDTILEIDVRAVGSHDRLFIAVAMISIIVGGGLVAIWKIMKD